MLTDNVTCAQSSHTKQKLGSVHPHPDQVNCKLHTMCGPREPRSHTECAGSENAWSPETGFDRATTALRRNRAVHEQVAPSTGAVITRALKLRNKLVLLAAAKLTPPRHQTSPGSCASQCSARLDRTSQVKLEQQPAPGDRSSLDGVRQENERSR